MDFKVGDRVYAHRKTFVPESWEEFLSGYPNQIATIKKVFTDGDIRIDDWIFHPSDLSHIYTFEGRRYMWKGEERIPELGEIVIAEFPSAVKGQPFRTQNINLNQSRKILKPIGGKMEETAKYKKLKDIDPATVWEAGEQTCPEFQAEYIRFCEKLFSLKITALDHHLNEVLSDDPKWQDWALKHGFIKELKKEKEKFYHVGQRFKSNTHQSDFILALTGAHQAQLIRSSYDGFWSRGILVNDCDKITQKEFDLIANNSKDFQLIEESSPSPSRDAGESSLNGEARS